MSAATTLENGFTSGLKTLKEAIAYRWSKDIWRDDMSKLLEKDLFSLWNRTKHEKAKGTVMLFNTAITVALFLQGCAIANEALVPKTPVGGGDTGPRSADTNIAPIRPMLIDGNFKGADQIKASCELKMGGICEVFGVVVPKENADPKIHPFVTHEGVDYVWGGSGRFDRLTQKPDQGKIKWIDDDGNIYFVGVPEAGSTTQLETLYYVDPDGKVLELPKPWGKLLASGIKSTQVPTETQTTTPPTQATSTPLAPTWTPTFAPTLKPSPIASPIVIPATPKPENPNRLPGTPGIMPDGSYPLGDGDHWSTPPLPNNPCSLNSPKALDTLNVPFDPNKNYPWGETRYVCTYGIKYGGWTLKAIINYAARP